MVSVNQGGCIDESRLRLCFDARYRVLSFDKSAWFRHLAGRGFKGVDVLALREGVLYLMEVKNFEQPAKGGNHLPPAPGVLVGVLEQKFRDSERLTGVVLGTLERYLLFRIWRWGGKWWPGLRRWEPEWAFWMDAARCISQGKTKWCVVLWHYPGVANHDWPSEWTMIHNGDAQLPGLRIVDV
jgi:hypothetical protein